MKKFIWFIGGIAAGLFAAKQYREHPQAQVIVDDASKRAKEFGAAVSEGFREREAELVSENKAPVKAKPASSSKAKPAAKSNAKPVAKPALKPVAKKPAVAKRAPAKKAPASKPVNKPSAN
jgi:hypothetical protein